MIGSTTWNSGASREERDPAAASSTAAGAVPEPEPDDDDLVEVEIEDESEADPGAGLMVEQQGGTGGPDVDMVDAATVEEDLIHEQVIWAVL